MNDDQPITSRLAALGFNITPTGGNCTAYFRKRPDGSVVFITNGCMEYPEANEHTLVQEFGSEKESMESEGDAFEFKSLEDYVVKLETTVVEKVARAYTDQLIEWCGIDKMKTVGSEGHRLPYPDEWCCHNDAVIKAFEKVIYRAPRLIDEGGQPDADIMNAAQDLAEAEFFWVYDDDIEKLACEFAKIIRESHTPETLVEIIERNRMYGRTTCATHDFEDANMSMLEAFNTAFGRDPAFIENPECENDQFMCDRAWDLAAINNFWAATSDDIGIAFAEDLGHQLDWNKVSNVVLKDGDEHVTVTHVDGSTHFINIEARDNDVILSSLHECLRTEINDCDHLWDAIYSTDLTPMYSSVVAHTEVHDDGTSDVHLTFGYENEVK